MQNLTKLENVKRRRGNDEESAIKRKFSIKYFLKVNHEMVRVCKKMFLATLGMKETTVLKWIKQDGNLEETIEIHEEATENKISKVRNSKFVESNSKLKEFLLSLPKV